jgi:hypothetical protein
VASCLLRVAHAGSALCGPSLAGLCTRCCAGAGRQDSLAPARLPHCPNCCCESSGLRHAAPRPANGAPHALPLPHPCHHPRPPPAPTPANHPANLCLPQSPSTATTLCSGTPATASRALATTKPSSGPFASTAASSSQRCVNTPGPLPPHGGGAGLHESARLSGQGSSARAPGQEQVGARPADDEGFLSSFLSVWRGHSTRPLPLPRATPAPPPLPSDRHPNHVLLHPSCTWT